jgi:hypothetical protein
LLRHARSLDAHHSPDLFHVHQDISRATSRPLQSKVKAAGQEVARAESRLQEVTQEAEEYERQRQAQPKRGRPIDYEKRIHAQKDLVHAALKGLEAAQQRREHVRDAARGLSLDYHPYDLRTGEQRETQDVASALAEHFDGIEESAAEAGLGPRSMKLLRKARRVLPQMVATIAFVHTLIRTKLAALELPDAVHRDVSEKLLPALYLDEVARKAQLAEQREDLALAAAALHCSLNAPGSALAALEPERQAQVRQVAQECALLFQRSSSSVEGRNGTLSLRHHSHHQLNPRKLAALTAVHNYATHRSDGTTPAQRFFGQPHRDLFSHLLESLPPPRRPAAKRTQFH